ncbi:MAG: hypothetical protein NTY97_06080 [Planctomycetota bacterium]|nr:hypothetical protein [Planctomycetota bacterium]
MNNPIAIRITFAGSIATLCGLMTFASSALAQAVAGADAAPRLPITSITLYRSGVGYFERHGMIKSGDSVQLRFAEDEINDMLKSMVIFDPQQALQSISYESNEPLARQLASFGIDLSDNPTLATILGRLRGTKVRFVTSDGPISGVVLGSEMRDQAQGSAQKAISIPFVNVITESGVRSVNLTTIVSVQLEDPALNGELMKALAALAAHSTDRFKNVGLSFGGTAARDVKIAYVNEMPIWKTSYRLVLPDEAKSKDQPMIQGWAIIENTTDDDWSNIQLALVASQPVSFEMNLSQSLHITRPSLDVPTVAGAAPRIYQDGDAFADKKEMRQAMAAPGSPPAAMRSMAKSDRAGGGGGSGGFGAVAMADGVNNDMETGMSSEELWKQSAIAQAQSSSVGEAFQYTMKNPISIGRQQSAMLPILTSAIDGRRVSIFKRGVELTNSTGLQLIPGPVAVFDAFTYAGDAQVGYMTLNDKRLLAYAVDLSVSAAVQDDSTNTMRSIRIVDGFIEETRKQVQRTSFAFNNKDAARGRTMLVETAKIQGWELAEPKKAAEETQSLYRFELTLKPSEKATFVVAQENTFLSRISVAQYDMPTLLAYASDKKASQAVIDAAKKAAAMQATMNATSGRITLLGQERQSIDTDQNRIRQNMASIDHDTEVYRRYLTKFNEQESRLEAILVQTTNEQTTLQSQQDALNDYVSSLNVS